MGTDPARLVPLPLPSPPPHLPSLRGSLFYAWSDAPWFCISGCPGSVATGNKPTAFLHRDPPHTPTHPQHREERSGVTEMGGKNGAHVAGGEQKGSGAERLCVCE